METKLKEIGSENDCVMAIMMRDEKILQGYRNYTKDKWKDISVWTNPGGRCNAGEIIEDALKREVQEEVDITEFTIVDFIGEVVGMKEGDNVLFFLCTTKQEVKLMEPEKFSEWCWVPKGEYIKNEEYGNFNSAARKLIVDYLQTIHENNN